MSDELVFLSNRAVAGKMSRRDFLGRAAALGEEAVTLEDVCEPYLMQKGFLARTPRGRCVTHLAYRHLDIALPAESPAASNQQTLEELLAGGEL